MNWTPVAGSERLACQDPECSSSEFWVKPDGLIVCADDDCHSEYGRLAGSSAGEAAVEAGIEASPEMRVLYRERARLVAFLAAIYPSCAGTDEKEPDWPVVYVETPAGQLSWHISQADMDLFEHVGLDVLGEPELWDGHDTAEKYRRLETLTASLGSEYLLKIRERLESLAGDLETSASRTHPSKKSQIEQGCAESVRQIAGSLRAGTGDGR